MLLSEFLDREHLVSEPQELPQLALRADSCIVLL